ncbi:hypothetical protein A2Z33_01895 [Candidatus Gottesmanbacteria bacterium RBG_16_52_11]|uniref:Uncharacterized protein n=1 Tax=Candidatus Gottesmanbacteria bacterium RBG_16_52_11 TaxID=1798374 RepID=A0A1F5YQT1_9BACT|nr:MAG: hypothetical protein A2Z33_01895 [Candidatus Gottesmanbacteria bacterium RBG_16_52_11]
MIPAELESEIAPLSELIDADPVARELLEKVTAFGRDLISGITPESSARQKLTELFRDAGWLSVDMSFIGAIPVMDRTFETTLRLHVNAAYSLAVGGLNQVLAGNPDLYTEVAGWFFGTDGETGLNEFQKTLEAGFIDRLASRRTDQM